MAGIYLHVPFCHSKCAYCDFYSVARPDKAGAFALAAEHEYASRISELAGEPVRTLYFGGGTPSILPSEIFSRLARLLMTADTEEFTIEVNPEDVDAQRIEAWKRAGVNRVSIGVQSLRDSELRLVYRRHDAVGALAAIADLRSAGIENISADLIYGLPGQTDESWRDSVRRLTDAGVTHLSAYCLSFEEGTLLTRKLRQGIVREASEEEIETRYGILCREMTAAGFEHYEISNFARPGFRSRHNSSYWCGVPYLGLGPGAHSLTAIGSRRFNPPDLRKYIAADGRITEDDLETAADRVNDLIMIRLRTAEGLEKDAVTSGRLAEIMQSAEPWLRSGHLADSGTHLFIPERSWLLADAVIRDLFVD